MLCKTQHAVIVAGILPVSSSSLLFMYLHLALVWSKPCSTTMRARLSSLLKCRWAGVNAPLSCKGRISQDLGKQSRQRQIRAGCIDDPLGDEAVVVLPVEIFVVYLWSFYLYMGAIYRANNVRECRSLPEASNFFPHGVRSVWEFDKSIFQTTKYLDKFVAYSDGSRLGRSEHEPTRTIAISCCQPPHSYSHSLLDRYGCSQYCVLSLNNRSNRRANESKCLPRNTEMFFPPHVKSVNME